MGRELEDAILIEVAAGLDRGVAERFAGHDVARPHRIGADRALGRIELVGGDRVAPRGERPGAIVATSAKDAARAGGGRKNIRGRRILAEAEELAARPARRCAPHVPERARRNGGADVAVAAQPRHAPEIEIVATGGDARPIGGDGGTIHDQQIRWQPQQRAVGLDDQVMDIAHARSDGREQLVIEVRGQFQVERICKLLPVLDDRDGRAQLIDLAIQRGGRGRNTEGAGTVMGDEQAIAVVVEDDHLVIRFAGREQRLQIGEADRIVGDGPVARELGEAGLGRCLLFLQLLERGAQRGGAVDVRGGRALRRIEPG